MVLFGRVAAAALLSLVSCVVGMPVTVTECMAEGMMPVVKVLCTLAPCLFRVWSLGIRLRFCLILSLRTLNWIGLPEA